EDPHWQPTTGAPIVEPDAPEDAKPIGAVTSSTRSPMLGDAIACFAQLKWDHTKPDSAVEISTARGRAKTTVRPTLRFWPKA
ncbi:MAG: glycine cleavage T C-terminal barrel domain-containing protein, partial [Planctomycetota bacterium]